VSRQSTTGYTYNDAGKLVKITYPDMQREEFLYDGDGMRAKHRPKSTLLAPKQWVKFTYCRRSRCVGRIRSSTPT
jgi:YD repeat-containing protein